MGRPITVQQIMADAAEARAHGYDELAQTFEELAARVAAFNETHNRTLQEIRELLGDNEFAALLAAGMNARNPEPGEAECPGCLGDGYHDQRALIGIGGTTEPYATCSVCDGTGVVTEDEARDMLAVSRAAIDQVIARFNEEEGNGPDTN